MWEFLSRKCGTLEKRFQGKDNKRLLFLLPRPSNCEQEGQKTADHYRVNFKGISFFKEGSTGRELEGKEDSLSHEFLVQE